MILDADAIIGMHGRIGKLEPWLSDQRKVKVGPREPESGQVIMERGNKVVYGLLGSLPSYICMDLTLNNIAKVLRTELGLDNPLYGLCPGSKLATGWHIHGTKPNSSAKDFKNESIESQPIEGRSQLEA